MHLTPLKKQSLDVSVEVQNIVAVVANKSLAHHMHGGGRIDENSNCCRKYVVVLAILISEVPYCGCSSIEDP